MKYGEITLKSFADWMNNIIAEKWSLMEEMNSCLPSISLTKQELRKRIMLALDEVMWYEHSDEDEIRRVFFETIPGPSRTTIALFAGEQEIEIARYDIIASQKYPNVAKGVKLNVLADTLTEESTLEEAFQYALTKDEKSVDLREVWLKLPERYAQDKVNWVCPQCAQRGSLRVGYFDSFYAVVCDSNSCSFMGPHRPSRSDAEEEWATTEKTSDYKKSFTKAKKRNFAMEEMEREVEKIKESLLRISSLKDNKKALLSKEVVEVARKELTAAFSECFVALSDK